MPVRLRFHSSMMFPNGDFQLCTRCHGVVKRAFRLSYRWNFLRCVAQGFSWAEDCSLSAISRQNSKPHATGRRFKASQMAPLDVLGLKGMVWVKSLLDALITTVENGLNSVE